MRTSHVPRGFSMLVLLILVACSHAPAPSEAPAAVEAGLATGPAAAQQRTLTLDPEALSYDEAAHTVTFRPDGDRQAAAYIEYVLDLNSFEAALGGRPTAPMSVLVEVSGGETHTVTPADPNLPAPEGGFQITVWTGRVLSVSGGR